MLVEFYLLKSERTNDRFVIMYLRSKENAFYLGTCQHTAQSQETSAATNADLRHLKRAVLFYLKLRVT